MTDLELREIAVTDRKMIARIGDLRVRSWRTEVPGVPEMTTWLEDFDQVARHWAILRDNEPVAAARLSVHVAIEDVPDAEVYAGVFKDTLPTPIGAFNRLVVDPEYRGLGFAGRLDQVRLAAAEQMGCRCIVATTTPGDRRTKQLQAIGFDVVGRGGPNIQAVLLRGIENLVLLCPLPRTGGLATGPT